MKMNKKINKYLFILIFLSIFLHSCSIDYSPNGNFPDENAGIEEIFPDTILDMAATIKLEFYNDTCRSISATYGDSSEIYYQLVLVNETMSSTENCLNKYILPKFKEYRRVKKNHNNFYAFGSNDVSESCAWIQYQYVFYMRCKNDYIKPAVNNSNYLILK